jgi:hypothetical protein
MRQGVLQILFNNTLRSFSMFKKAMIASAVLAAAFGAQAQSTASWSITGTVAASPCVITLAAPAPWNTLPIAQVKGWQTVAATVPVSATAGATYYGGTGATQRTAALDVTCATPAAVALRYTDGKTGTAFTPEGSASAFGLGTYTPAGGTATNIGAALINHSGLQIKALATDTLAAPAKRLVTVGTATGSSTWTTAVAGDAWVNPANSYAYSTVATDTVPGAVSQISGNLLFRLHMNKALMDAANSDINFASTGTVTLTTL